jgi:mannose-1-phosphate guanylyltransferase
VTGLALDDIGWNDVGSWEAVYDLADKDANGNASRGDLIAEDSRGNYVNANKTVALVGVENLIIVDTPDALLVGHRGKAQDVSKIVKALDAQKREELL